MVVDVLLEGLLTGGIYALIALGFVMVFKSSQILNLGYGQMVALAAYFLYWLLTSMGVPTWLGILILFAAGAVLGYVLERAIIRPLLGESFLVLLMATLMLGSLFQGIIVMVWGVESFNLPFTPGGMLAIWDWQVNPGAAWAFGIALLVFLLMTLVFRYTKVGLSMKVVAADHEVAQSLGIRVKRVFSLSWIISGLLAAMIGILVGMVWMVTPDSRRHRTGQGASGADRRRAQLRPRRPSWRIDHRPGGIPRGLLGPECKRDSAVGGHAAHPADQAVRPLRREEDRKDLEECSLPAGSLPVPRKTWPSSGPRRSGFSWRRD